MDAPLPKRIKASECNWLFGEGLSWHAFPRLYGTFVIRKSSRESSPLPSSVSLTCCGDALFPVDPDTGIMTISLEKEYAMEWWKNIAEGEPEIDTAKVVAQAACSASCTPPVYGLSLTHALFSGLVVVQSTTLPFSPLVHPCQSTTATAQHADPSVAPWWSTSSSFSFGVIRWSQRIPSCLTLTGTPGRLWRR